MSYIWKSIAWGTAIWLLIPFLGATVTFLGAPKSTTESDVLWFLLVNTMILWLSLAAGLMYVCRRTLTVTPSALLFRTAFVSVPIFAGFGAFEIGYGISWFSLGMYISSVALAREFIVTPPKG